MIAGTNNDTDPAEEMKPDALGYSPIIAEGDDIAQEILRSIDPNIDRLTELWILFEARCRATGYEPPD